MSYIFSHIFIPLAILFIFSNSSNISNFFPIVRGIVGKMTHRPVPAKLGNSNFRSDYSWDEIKEIMVSYFESRNIKYNTSKTTAAFTIVGIPKFSV